MCCVCALLLIHNCYVCGCVCVVDVVQVCGCVCVICECVRSCVHVFYALSTSLCVCVCMHV